MTAALVLAAVVAVLAAGALGWRSRMRAGARIDALAARVDPDDRVRSGTGLDGALDHLERAVARLEADRAEAGAAERRLVEAIDAIPQGVVVCDAEGAVVLHNRAGAVYTEARHGDALVEAAMSDLVGRALAGEMASDTIELFGPPRRTLTITAVPLGVGAPGAVATIDDVTERRRLEAVRRDFVANISHELKTPVGALALLAETLVDEEDPAVTARLAERMLDEAHRVGRTIDDLLELSRIEVEEERHRELVAVHQLLAGAVERIRPAADQRGIDLRVGEAHPRITVTGDRRQLVSAVFNLLENAVKYSDPGSPVELRARAHGAWVDIEVEDHGVGIPPRDLQRIFERFYRVDQARSRETGGTGLGLAIVRHIVTNHDGEVFVDSREGEGTTFTLRLPSDTAPFSETG